MRRITDDVVSHRLENGALLLVRESHATPLVSTCVMVRGGLCEEPEGRAGLTHLTQRTLLKGTRTRTGAELAAHLESHGIALTPFTGKDMAGASMASVARHFDFSMDVLCEVLWEPTFEAAAVERERATILQEIARKQDDPLGLSLEVCETSVFGTHPYRWPVSGHPESVASLTATQVQEWHAGLYSRPDTMVVAVVGDVAPAHVIERWEAAVARAPRRALDHVASPTVFGSGGEVSLHRTQQQAALTSGFVAPSLLAPDFPAFDVLHHLLSGMGSRLFIELRDRQGLAYVVSASYDPRIEAGCFRCYLATRPEQQRQARTALRRELDRLQDDLVPEDELHRTVEYMRGLHAIGLQRNGAQASRLAWYEMAGLGYAAVDQEPEWLPDVQTKDVQRCAQTYLDPELQSDVLVTPDLHA